MTCTTHTNCTDLSRRPVRLGTMIKAANAWFRAELRIRRDLQRLELMDAHLLRDIGLHEGGLERALRFGDR